MKPLFRQSLLVAALLTGLATGARAADFGVSLHLGDPGFFGQIDVGGAPAPQLIYPDPVIIERPREGAMPPPVYLRVPPGRERHWSRYCHEYRACDRPVFFVRDAWYRDVYVQHYREHHGDRPDERRDDRREDRRDDRRDDDRRDH